MTLFRLIFLGCLVALFYGLFRETPPPKVFDQSDKVGHLIGFAVFTLSGLLALPQRFLAMFLSFTVALALSAEFLQEWLLPGRFYSLQDMYANLAGIAITLIPWLIWFFFRKRASQHNPEYSISERTQ